MPIAHIVKTTSSGPSPFKPGVRKIYSVRKPDSPLSVSAASSNGRATNKRDEPQQAVSANVSPSLPPQGESKDKERDVRAYEHDRQRIKQAQRWAAKKAKKGLFGNNSCTSETVSSSHQQLNASSPIKDFGKVKGKLKKTKSADLDIDWDYDCHNGWKEHDGAASGGSITPTGDFNNFNAVSHHQHQKPRELGLHEPKLVSTLINTGPDSLPTTKPPVVMSLSDLVVFSTSRKSRKRKEDDFEIIPALRSVIMLDDIDVVAKDTPKPVDADDAWECVEVVSDDEEEKDPSYAQILTGISPSK
jgi:hypothetical protein